MSRQAFIYLLHFDVPLSHAEHYSGCTHELRQRLTRHATGAGSALTRALHERGVSWRLAALGTCNHSEMRRRERELKAQCNGPRFCPICTAYPQPLPGTLPYPIEELKFPIASRAIIQPQKRLIRVRHLPAAEPKETMLSIRSIADQEKDCLGWIPCTGAQGLQTLQDKGEGLTVVEALGDLGPEVIAYAAWTQTHDRTRLTIHQAAVREDQRLQQYGRSLVTAIAAGSPTAIMVAKVRDDLAANHFWGAIGFERVRSATHKTSRATIHHYYRQPLIRG